MELTFTGRGAMLYPSEGNTAAFFEEDNNLFLVDRGEDVAVKLINNGKLNKDCNVYLFVTHTHSDHIGSLGTLQQYLYWVCGKKLNIVYSQDIDNKNDIEKIASGFGLHPDTYCFVEEKQLDNKFDAFEQIRYVSSNHGEVCVDSSSLIIKTKNGYVLYSGDIADSEIIEYFIKISKGFIDKMYIDTSYTDSSVHLSIHKLNEVIPKNLKNKVYCMHINNKAILPIIEEYGFNLVTLWNDDLLTRDIETMNRNELELLEEELIKKLDEVHKLFNE